VTGFSCPDSLGVQSGLTSAEALAVRCWLCAGHFRVRR